MQKRKIIIPTLALGIVTAVGFSNISSVSADDKKQSDSQIVEKVAEKFNLDQDEVKQVFDDFCEERRARAEEKRKERLNKLVSEGKLTEDQKNALITKQEEMRNKKKSFREEMKNISREDRKEKTGEHRKECKEEMNEFFEEQGIDPEEIFPNHKKHNRKRGLGNKNGEGRMNEKK